MTSISKNVYIDKLDDLVNEQISVCHRTNKMKPADVKSGSYIEYNLNSSGKNPKFKIGDHVKKSKYKSIFAEAWLYC